uniref:FIIND domain-containing protein n=1 Tax=Latimeria chalumnae TaxID=7897 RepID=H3B192_LATCH
YSHHLKQGGAYKCSASNIRWEVTRETHIEYKTTLWEDHLTHQQRNSWIIAGLLWEITANSEDITAIHLPHFIDYQALNDLDPPLIQIANFKDGSVSLEPASKVHPTRVVFENPKFSLLGVIICLLPCIRPIPVKGLVMVYHSQEAADVTLHVYIIPDDPAMQEAIKLKEKGSRHIMKPPVVRSMYFGHDYLLKSPCKQVEIKPKQGVEFCYVRSGQTINFYEVYSKNVNENITLWLHAMNSETCLWEAEVRPGDLSSHGDQTEADSQYDLINREHRRNLIKHINVMQPICSNLLDYNIITDEEKEAILSHPTASEKKR